MISGCIFAIIRIMSRGNLFILSLSIIFWCFRQVRLVSFFVSSLFVPDAERVIVLARRGIFWTRTEISRFFLMLKKIIPTILHTKERRRRLGCVPKHIMHMRNIGHVPVSNFAISIYYVASNFEITVKIIFNCMAKSDIVKLWRK